jgi:hypothetical protein
MPPASLAWLDFEWKQPMVVASEQRSGGGDIWSLGWESVHLPRY